MNDLTLVTAEYLRAFVDEQERLSQLLGLLKGSSLSQIIDRKNFVGHVTASGFVLSPCRKNVLLIQHPTLNLQLQPGGHVQPSDSTPLDSARREIKEETGLAELRYLPFHSDSQIPIDIDTHPIPANPALGEPKHWHHDFRYLFVSSTNSVSKHFGAHWKPIEELARWETFKAVVAKIRQALSSEFAVKFFYDEVIARFDNTQRPKSIVVTHMLPDIFPYLDALARMTDICAIFAKPRSIVPAVKDKVGQRFKVIDLKREAAVEKAQTVMEATTGNFVLFDIGGYFAELASSSLSMQKSNILGIVEDTQNGHKRYEQTPNLVLPVVSVARSPLKDYEDFLVGQSVVFSADAILRELGTLLQYMRIGILGCGKIGKSILIHALQRNASVMVYDNDPVRRLQAFNIGAQIPDREVLIADSEVIFSATGNQALDIQDFRNLRPGSYVFSVTSSDDEMDLAFLESEYKHEDVAPYITKHYSFYNYFFLINKGNAVNFIHNAALGDFIHLVRAEMLVALSLIRDGALAPGLTRVPEPDLKNLATVWIERCVLDRARRSEAPFHTMTARQGHD